MALCRQSLCLLGAITASPSVSGQFTADGRGVSLEHDGYLALFVSRLLQGVNLVSFFSGEVCVVHLCNFDWLVKKAWMLPHPAHLTGVTQNCTSFLNPRKITASKKPLKSKAAKDALKKKQPLPKDAANGKAITKGKAADSLSKAKAGEASPKKAPKVKKKPNA
jgi:hypothetical protein